MARDEQLVFGPTIEGLFVRGLKDKLPPALVLQLKELGLDLTKPILPAYPRAVVNAAVLLTAKTLYPNDSLADAFYKVGQHVSIGAFSTVLGSATLRLVKLVGPTRALQRIARTFRTTNNYMTVALRELAPTDWELELSPSNDQPSYMQAVIEDVMKIAGAKELKVETVNHDKANERCTYRVRWS